MRMLGWKKGMTWKVKQTSWVPSLAAVMDPPDEVVEDELTYEIVKDDGDLWVASVSGIGRYELVFFKQPLALQGIRHHDRTREGKELVDELLGQMMPMAYLHGHLMAHIPLIVDFPVLKKVPSTHTLREKEHGLKVELVFEEGRPFWTHATRYLGQKKQKEARLI